MLDYIKENFSKFFSHFVLFIAGIILGGFFLSSLF